MEVHVLASGSSGNCALLAAGRGDDRVVLCQDAGIPQRPARALARVAGLELCAVDAVLLTHRHSDHAANVVQVAARAGAPLFAHPDALGHAERTSEAERTRRGVAVRHLAAGCDLAVGPLRVRPLALPHDAEPTFGFLYEHESGARLGFFTDLGDTTPLENGALDGVDVLVLEANHDRELLAAGRYPPHLKARVGGPLGHLGNHQLTDFLAAWTPSSLRVLVLAHLSERNNAPELAVAAARDGLRRAGRGDVRIEVAPKRGPLSVGPDLVARP